jgi:hypothetical protein
LFGDDDVNIAFRLKLNENFVCGQSRQAKIKIDRFPGNDNKLPRIPTISGDASEQNDS